MGTAWVIGAIGSGAVAFMLRFLIALLREGAPSLYCWVVSVRGRPRATVLQALSGSGYGDERRSAARNRGDYRVELLENDNHENGKYGSGLITLDGRIVSAGLGPRAIHPRHNYVLRERRLWFE